MGPVAVTPLTATSGETEMKYRIGQYAPRSLETAGIT